MAQQATQDLSGLDRPYPLTSDQVSAYQRDGHLLLREVCPRDLVGHFRAVIAEYVKKNSAESRPMNERDTYGKAFLQVFNLWRGSEEAARFVLARRFAGIAARLMGVDNVRLYHDQALFKEGGGGHTPWHQDQHYWPLDTDNTITMWMPLVDISREMGTMNFASESHAEGYLGDMPISDSSEESLRRFIQEKGYGQINYGSMAAGDATFHSGWVLHGAPGNATDRTREVMTVIYFADGTRVSEIDNPNRELDLKTWLPGCQPGGPAASELNPVLL